MQLSHKIQLSCSVQLTCLVICHTQSMNCRNIGDLSWSAWFLSPWPILCECICTNTLLILCDYLKLKLQCTSLVTQNFLAEVYKYRMCTHRGELVSKADPLLLDQHLEAPECAVVRVQHQHGQGGELSRAVPAVTAVHHHRAARAHFICYLNCSRQHQLQREKNT